MTKQEIVQAINEETGVPKVDCLVVVEQFIANIKKANVQGDTVYIRGFGSFGFKNRAAKIGRNVKKNTAVNIPAHTIPYFKPAPEYAMAVRVTNTLIIIKEESPIDTKDIIDKIHKL
jgi:DNA-binding protein HU-beta